MNYSLKKKRLGGLAIIFSKSWISTGSHKIQKEAGNMAQR